MQLEIKAENLKQLKRLREEKCFQMVAFEFESVNGMNSTKWLLQIVPMMTDHSATISLGFNGDFNTVRLREALKT